jgi:hypothetical protein
VIAAITSAGPARATAGNDTRTVTPCPPPSRLLAQWLTLAQVIVLRPRFLLRRPHRAMLARTFWRLVREWRKP